MAMSTKVSKGFQTVVPSRVRKRLKVDAGDEIVWSIVGNELYLRIRKVNKSDPLEDLIGKLPTEVEANATEEIDEVAWGKE